MKTDTHSLISKSMRDLSREPWTQEQLDALEQRSYTVRRRVYTVSLAAALLLMVLISATVYRQYGDYAEIEKILVTIGLVWVTTSTLAAIFILVMTYLIAAPKVYVGSESFSTEVFDRPHLMFAPQPDFDPRRIPAEAEMARKLYWSIKKDREITGLERKIIHQHIRWMFRELP